MTQLQQEQNGRRPGAFDWPGLALGAYDIRLARGDDELELVHRLVYRTFVRELGQYPDGGQQRWVDKYHYKNTYLVAIADGQLHGMLAVHDSPPFSVADALPSAELLMSLCPRLLEVRLLAIEPARRGRVLFGGLVAALHHFATWQGYRYLTISCLLQRQAMYQRMGFRALGPPLRKGQADFVPMLLELERMPSRPAQHLRRLATRYLSRS